jgi:predicted transcriptional regulator
VGSNQPSSKPDLYVVARIVNALRNEGPTKRTQLATMTRLSYDVLVKYLEWMSQKGLVEVDSDDNVRLTPQGYKVYDRLVSWILEYVGRLHFPRF